MSRANRACQRPENRGILSWKENGAWLGFLLSFKETGPAYLLDQSNRRVAVLSVTFTGTHYEGTIALDHTPPKLKRLFEEYEEIFEGQMFSLLDSIEEKIGVIPLKVSFENRTEANVEDLPVFPSTEAISFKTRQPVKSA